MPTSHQVIVVSDIHFPVEHKQAFQAFKSFVKTLDKPQVVWNGDIIDLPSLSVYPPEADIQPYAAVEIETAIMAIHSLAEHCGNMYFVPGNHEARYEKTLYGNKAVALKGLKGLTLREQFYSLGLDDSIQWISEKKGCPGWTHSRSKTLVRHGHRQAGKYGAVNIAAKLARENPGVNLVVGHHHRAQLHTQTVLGRPYFTIANPHLSGEHEYSLSPDWQRGFTVLDFYGHSTFNFCHRVTPHLVVMDESGRFSFGGKVYE